MIYRPTRERSKEQVVEIARELLANTGYDEISLMSLSTTDHREIYEIVTALTREFPGLKVSIPSTRVDTFSVRVAEAVAAGKKHNLTLAPEAAQVRDDHQAGDGEASSRGGAGVQPRLTRSDVLHGGVTDGDAGGRCDRRIGAR
jgi:hypothetical protein